jgi:hypothetical protein
MNGFKLWLLVLESGRFDRAGFNRLFRDQLAELLPRVRDADRRAGIDGMRDFDFVAYILAALRNAGFADAQEREQAAHDVVVYLLVSPGQLFAGYGDRSGPLEARFRIAVQNAVRNQLRSRRRGRLDRTAVTSNGTADTEAHASEDAEEVMAAFRAYLAAEVGEDSVKLLDRRLDGVSLRRIARDPAFSGLSAWSLRRLMSRVRDAAVAFARRHGDDGFLAAVERLTGGR